MCQGVRYITAVTFVEIRDSCCACADVLPSSEPETGDEELGISSVAKGVTLISLGGLADRLVRAADLFSAGLLALFRIPLIPPPQLLLTLIIPH
jgi:hypothetical protein